MSWITKLWSGDQSTQQTAAISTKIQLSALDKLIDELHTASSSLSLEELWHIAARVQHAVSHNSHQVTRTLKRSMSELHDEHLKHHVCCYRGRKLLLLGLASGVLQLAAGTSALAPAGFFQSATRLNGVAAAFSGGRLNTIIPLSNLDPSSVDGLQKISDVFYKFFSGGAGFTGQMTEIGRNWQNSHTVHHQAMTDHAKSEKTAHDQQSSQDAQRTSTQHQQIAERDRALHDAKTGILRS